MGWKLCFQYILVTISDLDEQGHRFMHLLFIFTPAWVKYGMLGKREGKKPYFSFTV